MAERGGDRDRGRNAGEDQQRRHQEAAANSEHAGEKTNPKPQRDDDQPVD